jgi:predicted HAD superfamily Cof-like phosphohydrolase
MTKSAHFKRVDEFHKSYGMPRGTVTINEDFSKLTEKDAKRIKLRSDLTSEEYRELATADTPEEIMKESCDLVYVIMGMFVEFGWNFDEAFKRVHESNMSKLDEDGKPIYREDGKILKGPNYTPPTLKDLL